MEHHARPPGKQLILGFKVKMLGKNEISLFENLYLLTAVGRLKGVLKIRNKMSPTKMTAQISVWVYGSS
jgi:hypothetical protein